VGGTPPLRAPANPRVRWQVARSDSTEDDYGEDPAGVADEDYGAAAAGTRPDIVLVPHYKVCAG
jgi:hypothetical protein